MTYWGSSRLRVFCLSLPPSWWMQEPKCALNLRTELDLASGVDERPELALGMRSGPEPALGPVEGPELALVGLLLGLSVLPLCRFPSDLPFGWGMESAPG